MGTLFQELNFYYAAETQNYHQFKFLLSLSQNSCYLWELFFKNLNKSVKNIQQAQISQKKQYDKGCHPVSVEVGLVIQAKGSPTGIATV